MKSDPEIINKTLLNAQQALQRGDRQAARRWAEKSIELAPDAEEPWLILAALANPRASVKYLEQALKINPQSQRARKGMHWAAGRLRQLQLEDTNRGGISRPVVIKEVSAGPEIQPEIRKPPSQFIARSASSPDLLLSKSISRYRWSFLTLFLIAICITAAWVFWPGNASPVLAFLRAPHSTLAFPGVLANVSKPSYTPSPTSTFTPTATFTQTPTFTLTPTPTDTPTVTETSTPTDTPLPTNTDIPWPTNTSAPIVSSDSGGVHWIDVNLSEQTLYAYEGNTIVASFLVSTGVPAFPTVTGQFHVYMKFVYTDMSGDGYYLPNVPYTMYFYKGYGIHGTYWHNNFGHPMSHGCVNMYTPDAEWVYYWAPMGTLVNVHY